MMGERRLEKEETKREKEELKRLAEEKERRKEEKRKREEEERKAELEIKEKRRKENEAIRQAEQEKRVEIDRSTMASLNRMVGLLAMMMEKMAQMGASVTPITGPVAPPPPALPQWPGEGTSQSVGTNDSDTLVTQVEKPPSLPRTNKDGGDEGSDKGDGTK